MSTRETLLHEIEEVPEPLLEEVLDFVQFIRAKVHGPRAGQSSGTKPRQWRELRGALPCPACGEDAQQWVSRSRREADENRGR